MTAGHNSSSGPAGQGPAPGPHAAPRVSVIAATYNEERYIEQFAACMAAQDFPARDFEVLIVDGGSRDKTRPLAEAIVRRDPRFRLVDNPDRFQPQARNVGVRQARGEIVVVADVHAAYPPDFIRASVDGLQRSGAWCVGPILTTEPGADTRTARAIAIVQSHPFGVGNSQARIGKEASVVDSLAFPCLRKSVFEKVGLFHERLPRHEDTEFFGRIRRAGGTLMVMPSIRATYFARPAVMPLLAQAWANGYETATAKVADPASTSLRHWIPGFFVASLVVFGMGGIALPVLWCGFALAAGSYLLVLAAASLHVGFTRSWPLVPWVAPLFVLHHLAYGTGTLAGIWGLARDYRKIKNYRHPTV